MIWDLASMPVFRAFCEGRGFTVSGFGAGGFFGLGAVGADLILGGHIDWIFLLLVARVLWETGLNFGMFGRQRQGRQRMLTLLELRKGHPEHGRRQSCGTADSAKRGY
jgi:hypothetical protein